MHTHSPAFARSALQLSRWTLAAALAAGSAASQAQTPGSPTGPGAASVANSTGSTAATGSRPTWGDLSASQRQALAPLAPHWERLSENHKRKWLTISRNFSDWPADEQERMHGRMSAWAGLSATERDQARLNYAEARKLAPDEKKARWEAYQALSEEQRGKLASSTATKRPGVAAPARPSRPTAASPLAPAGSDLRRIAGVGASGTAVDHNTLLPQHLAAP